MSSLSSGPPRRQRLVDASPQLLQILAIANPYILSLAAIHLGPVVDTNPAALVVAFAAKDASGLIHLVPGARLVIA